MQGVENNNTVDEYWPGGSLVGVRRFRVTLKRSYKVVYQAHDYGPDMGDKVWFNASDYPSNLDALWMKQWEYIPKGNLGALVVGQFGGNSTDNTTKEGQWQNHLVDYIRSNNVDFIYWALNPDTPLAGGLLLSDWTTPDPNKKALLSRIL